jgi:serine protease Do
MRGVHVRDVVRSSPADTGGVRRGDIILSADGRPVRTIWALVLAVRRHAVGDEISVLVRRDGNLVELKMSLGSRPDGST